MKTMEDIGLTSERKHEAVTDCYRNSIKHHLLLSITPKNYKNYDSNMYHHSDCESAISMNCKCTRISMLSFLFCFCFILFIGNVSLSIQLVNGGLVLGKASLEYDHIGLLTNRSDILDDTIFSRNLKINSNRGKEAFSNTFITSSLSNVFQARNVSKEQRQHPNWIRKISPYNSSFSVEEQEPIGQFRFAGLNFGLRPMSTTKNHVATETRVKKARHIQRSRLEGKTKTSITKKKSHTKTKKNKKKEKTENRTKKHKRKQKNAQNKTKKLTQKPLEPLSESLLPNATFSACLIIRDDNDILNEWIAYHYHVVRMRYMVVAVDPLSSESPESILNTWSNHTDLRVDVWDDADYMPTEFLRTNHPPSEYLHSGNNAMTDDVMEISNHRYRQRVFLNSCMKHVRDVKGMNWLMHIDTDEYIVPSKLLRQMNPEYIQFKPLNESGAVLDLLQQTVSKTRELISYPCISMLRVLFGSKESQMEDIPTSLISTTNTDFLNPNKFETLRWRYHALLQNQTVHGNPKVILDVAAIPSKYFDRPQEPVYSIHRPVMEYCPKNTELLFSNYLKQPLSVNHYLGSWERYSERNDKRRSKAVYRAKADAAERGIDDILSSQVWLTGFVNHVGLETAKVLLQQYR